MTEPQTAQLALRLATELARARSEEQVARATARTVAAWLGASAARVWLLDREKGYRCVGAWPEEADPGRVVAADVARVMALGTASVSSAATPHRSRITLPLLGAGRPLGAIELFETERPQGPFQIGDDAHVYEVTSAAGSALEGLRSSAAREQGQLEAITRLTRLFDLGRSVFATLEMEELSRVVVSRVQASLGVESVYFWIYDPTSERLSVAGAVGPAAETVLDWKTEIGEGAQGQAAATREIVSYDDRAEIPDLDARPDVAAGLEIDALAAAPILTEDDDLLGVLEVINRKDDVGFVASDRAMLREVASAAAIAIANVRRMDAERRAGDLSALLEVAQELGSSLDPQRVAFTLVHRASAAILYRRAAVGLITGNRFQLAAVSGQTFVDEKQPEMLALRDILGWASGLDEGLYVVQEDDGEIDTDRPETREKFRAYFEATGSRSFLIVPLRDDEGALGVFALEAAEPYAFSEHTLEVATLLALQASVALRNALLYQQIPMVKVFRPLARQRERLRGQPTWKRFGWLGAALLVVLLLVVPVPLRVGGPARVLPERQLPVTAQVEGRLAQILVREGDSVQAGQVLGILDEADYRVGKEAAAARFEIAAREASRFRADGQPGGAAVEQARLDGLQAEVDLWDTRLAATRLLSPIAGVVATPRIEEKVGSRIGRGEVLCEVVDPRRRAIEVSIPEVDAARLRPGQPVKIKMNAYPTRAFRGTVERVGVTAVLEDGETVFLLRVHLEDPEGKLLQGMMGQAKVNTGLASLGRVLFRQPGRWIWKIAWGWLP